MLFQRRVLPFRGYLTMAQAFAVSGAVIVGIDDSRVTYKKKCDRCGYIDSGNITMDIPSRGSSANSSNMCFRCKNVYEIKIQGG
jgi:hypothetical protein